MCWKEWAELDGKESYRGICTDALSSRRLARSCSAVLLLLRAAVHCVTATIVFQQDRRSKVALHEEGSRQTWTHRHAVSLHTSDFRTAAALHSSDAQTLLCKQVCSWSGSSLSALLTSFLSLLEKYFSTFSSLSGGASMTF